MAINAIPGVDIRSGLSTAGADSTASTSTGGPPGLTPRDIPQEAPGSRIYQQIEQTADTYPPTVYDLLTQYGRLSTETDETASSFFPLSQQGAYSKDAKMFVIGVLPPSSNVTGRKLDRSASVASISGYADEINVGGPQGGAGLPGGDVPPDFWVKYVAMCKKLGIDPRNLAKVLFNESRFKTTSVAVRNGQPIAKGLNQLVKDTAVKIGMSPEEWDRLETESADRQLYWVQRYFQRVGAKGASPGDIYLKNFGGYHYAGNPPGICYASMEYQKAYVASHPNFRFPGRSKQEEAAGSPFSSFQQLAYAQNPGFDTGNPKVGAITVTQVKSAADNRSLPADIEAEIAKAEAAIKAGAKGDLTEGNAPVNANGTPNWEGGGSKDAKNAQKTISKTANKDLNTTDLGFAFQAAQDAIIKATQRAIDQMARTPPLKLLVNPTSFKTSAEKIISDGNYGRNGPIVEVWGEQQDKIEGSGKLAAFYATDAETGYGPGVTRTARNASASYQNFLSLYLLYKNNAGIWLNEDNVGVKIGPPTLSVLGSVYIYYDNTLYVGSFDSFNITESDTNPFSLEYSFTFSVRASFLLDSTERL